MASNNDESNQSDKRKQTFYRIRNEMNDLSNRMNQAILDDTVEAAAAERKRKEKCNECPTFSERKTK